MMNRCYLLLLLLAFVPGIQAQPGGGGQNKTCETAAPFCTGTQYSFPAGVNAPAGQIGPNYGCLVTRPNPAWYYMKVDNPGNIIIEMHSVPGKDIDFCCWGPFTSQFCCTQLTSQKIVDCSYSPLAYETCDIIGAQTGEYYMLVITNFSNQPCNIIFEQTSGTGTTDCSILPPPCSSNSPICDGQTLQFSAQAISGATYFWWGPAGFSSNLQNPVINNATPANSGEYFLRVEVSGQSSADTSTTMVNVFHPVANAGNDTTILNGVSTTLHGSCSSGTGQYRYKWSPSSKLLNDSVQHPQTVNLFSTSVFTLTVTDDSIGCQSTDLVTVSIAGGALAVNAIANPQSICAGASTQLEAIGSGGAGNYTYQWSGPNGFSSTLQNPTVVPVTTSTYTVNAFDGYNTVTSSVTITVKPLPVADAGPPQTIPNGTYTWLTGSATGGSGNYFYSWTPVDKLINAGVQNPRTVNLSSSVVYSLQVTDLTTNCTSSNGASVPVVVEGTALAVAPVTVPPQVCPGGQAQLFALASGGNAGHYHYQWSSDPPGFSSTEANPFVNPAVPTTYFVTVTDEFNPIEGQTALLHYPVPQIHLAQNDTIVVCTYDSVTLDAANPGSSYLWSNGANTRTIHFGTTGIGYDLQHYSVEVTSEHGCSSSGQVFVLFTFDACTGISENSLAGRFRIWPNPASRTVRISDVMQGENVKVSLMSVIGKVLGEYSLISTGTENATIAVDLTGFTKGIYLVRFDTENLSVTQKLVVE